jgi:hypothetical protein
MPTAAQISLQERILKDRYECGNRLDLNDQFPDPKSDRHTSNMPPYISNAVDSSQTENQTNLVLIEKHHCI